MPKNRRYPKQRPEFCKMVRKGKNPMPQTPFEENYAFAWTYRRLGRKGAAARIAKLKALATVNIYGNPKPYWERRAKKHHPRGKRCDVCRKQPATCQHHIILLSKGGYDSGCNRIPICDDCHAQVHPWLADRTELSGGTTTLSRGVTELSGGTTELSTQELEDMKTRIALDHV